MILSSLYQLYGRLLENPDSISCLARVPAYGFTDENISYALVLSEAGELVDVIDVRDQSDKKITPKRIDVPRPEKRTSGVKPNFLWDKTSYVLGVEGNKDKDTAKEKPWVVNEKTHHAFRQYHLDLLGRQEDIALQALREFLLNWKPEHFSQSFFRDVQADANVVFQLDGELGYLHDRPAAQKLWLSLIQPADDSSRGICLITGRHSVLSRLHPAIKGVYGGQSSGVSIVSFNAPAYESFGKAQGDNAPVSEAAAFAYTTALNYLLRRENKHCLLIADTSTVFWAQAQDFQQEQQAVDLFAAMINPEIGDETETNDPSAAVLNSEVSDAVETKKLRLSLEKIAKGRPIQEVAPDVALDTRFFVLGLAPNASRLSIRYWLDSTLGQVAENLSAHWQDMQLEPLAWKEGHPPSVWRCLIQTAALGKTENISPQLSGELLRSILTGQRYPRMLLTQLVQRMRSDGDFNGLRVALIKAVLQRDYRKGFIREGVPMSFDMNNGPEAYRLGCLFAVLEQAQHHALGSVNASIVDRYYGTASSVPYSVFPRLIAGFQNHLSKVRKEKPGLAVNLDKQIGAILQTLPPSFSKQLTIEQQGQFAVGYYHQKQSFFAKKETKEESTDDQ